MHIHLQTSYESSSIEVAYIIQTTESWLQIANMGRAPCCNKNELKKGPWSPEEDQKLVDHIEKHGIRSWRSLPSNAGLLRCGKSCRVRWMNYLRPDIKRGRFSFEEEETIIQLHRILGNKWSAIAARLPGRTDTEIKNYWNSHTSKRLLRMGIDPATHGPSSYNLTADHHSPLLFSQSLYSPTQLLVSRILGLKSLLHNLNLLTMAKNILSSQNSSLNIPHQNINLEQQFNFNSRVQESFTSFENQLENPSQEILSAENDKQLFEPSQWQEDIGEEFDLAADCEIGAVHPQMNSSSFLDGNDESLLQFYQLRH